MPLFNRPHRKAVGSAFGANRSNRRFYAGGSNNGNREGGFGLKTTGETRARHLETPRPEERKLALSRDRHLDRFGRSARHRRNAAVCSPVRRGGHGRRLRRALRQSQRLAYFSVQLRHDVFVVFQELAGILASLANAFALVAEPRSGLLEDVVVHSDVEHISLTRSTLPEQHVYPPCAERRRDLVLR